MDDYGEEYEDEYESEEEDDPQFYLRDERAELMQITVSDPTEMPNGRTYYKVVGFDRTGRFETTRRYNDFYALFSVFRERLPGLYIPSLPPKKFIVSAFYLSNLLP